MIIAWGDSLDSIKVLQKINADTIDKLQDSINALNQIDSIDYQSEKDQLKSIKNGFDRKSEGFVTLVDTLNQINGRLKNQLLQINSGKTLISTVINNSNASVLNFLDSIQSSYSLPLSLSEDSIDYSFFFSERSSQYRLVIKYESQTIEDAKSRITRQLFGFRKSQIRWEIDGLQIDSMKVFDCNDSEICYSGEVSLVLYY